MKYSDVINKLSSKMYNDEIAISTLTVNNFEINLVYLKGKNRKQLKNEAKLRSIAKLKRNKLNKSYIVYLDINEKSKSVKSIVLDCVYQADVKRRNQKKLDMIAEELFQTRMKNILRQTGKSELEDVMLCPCGSGEIYGECCKIIDV